MNMRHAQIRLNPKFPNEVLSREQALSTNSNSQLNKHKAVQRTKQPQTGDVRQLVIQLGQWQNLLHLLRQFFYNLNMMPFIDIRLYVSNFYNTRATCAALATTARSAICSHSTLSTCCIWNVPATTTNPTFC
jgi:hypothetical protein